MNETARTREYPGGKFLKLVFGDLTLEEVDAIVNAANSHLAHGGGVAGAIVRKGGYEIQEESNRIGFVPVGEAAITGAGRLKAKRVIHAVGPRWGEGNEDQKLKNAVLNSLILAEKHHLQTISLPPISSGIFGFPKDRCARIILETVDRFLRENPDSALREVRICIIDQPTQEIFLNEFDRRFPPEND
ncbi:MAG: macro domain-containing protein [Calditrichia bacterium]